MNERNKKIYAIIIAILLVLSISSSFLPSIQVKADEQISIAISDLDFFDKVQSSSDVFTLELYNQGLQDNTSLSDSIKYNTASASTIFANNDTNLITNTDTILGYLNSHNLIFNDYGSDSQIKTDLHDFISNPNDFYKYYIFGNSPASNDPVLYIFYSRSEVNGCVVNGSYGTYYIKETSASPVYRMTLNGVDSDQSKDYRDIIVHNASDVPTKVLDNIFIAYSSFPIYFSYYDRGYSGDTYTNFDSPSKVVNAVLVNNETSDFLIDRRTLFSNFVPDTPDYTVDTDPISQEKVGIYNFDFYPSGGVTSGIFVIDNLQLSKKASEMDDVNLYALISFNYNVNALDYTYNENAFNTIQRHIRQNYNEKSAIYKFVNNNNLETTTPLTDESYQTFSARSIMTAAGPIDDANGYNSDLIQYYNHSVFQCNKITSFDMFDLYTISNQLNYVAPSQTSPKTLVTSSNNHVKNFIVTCSIKVDYGDGGVSETLATKSYNYLTGEVTSSGFTSVDNNTPMEDIPSDVQGMLDNINSGGFNDGVGGNVNNNSSNSNVNNPSFVNNNNPTITIENNNNSGGGWLPDDTQQDGILSQFWAVWSTFEVIQHFTQAVNDNEFLSFIFSSELWQVPGMAIIIPSLVIMILVSILSTIVRFIRGN